MDYHKLLRMQLNKSHLDADSLPRDLEVWKLFIESVNRSYINDDNDRYLLERSMQLSSSEMKKLNEMLENAQKIARMGYWSYDISTNEITWSKHAYYMFGIDNADNADNADILYSLVKEEYRDIFKGKIENSFLDGKEFECEIPIKSSRTGNAFRWHRIIAKPVFDKSTSKATRINFVSTDVTLRKIAEEELQRLNAQLIVSARRAGMADVATSVLHNVGNILNSANVSLGLLTENINDPSFNKLLSIKELLSDHLDNIGDYLTKDSKGKIIPNYLIALATKVDELNQNLKVEVTHLTDQLQHIKDITAMQKDISGVSDMNERIFVYQLIDTAIMMCDPAIESKSIKVVKDYKDNIYINSDRAKILQILVNLIQNAKESLLSLTDNRQKILRISCYMTNSNYMEITVEDNGIGISKEVIKKIYTLGFTTKKNGHGFGMHSSSLAAKELQGDLAGTSHGIDQGAAFTLTLPIQSTMRGENHESGHELEGHSN